MATGLHFARMVSRLRERLPRLARGWLARGARRSVRRLQPAFAAGRQGLADFGQYSDGEFTGLAEGLGSLDARLAEIRTQAAELDNILQDHDEDRALSSAFELFKKSVDLAHASIGIALSQEEEMTQMEGRLLHNRKQFAQNSLLFRVLVLNLRAEAARIDPENRAIFVAVAGEMEAMERQMSATVSGAFAELEAIVHEAAAGRRQLQGLQGNLQACAQRSIQVLRHELEQIKTNLTPCAEASRRITGLLAQTRTQTGELIVSLQYQDIVRQQLEHVGQGFDDLASHLGPAGSKAALDLGYLQHAARVQQTQLNSSRRAIEEAGGKIGDAGRALLATGAALGDQFAQMEEIAQEVFRDSRVGQLFKQETENLVQIASQSEHTNDRITRLLERIEVSLRVFSSEISHHEFEVQLVALNAQIAAARVPSARALDKLAEETATVSWSTAGLTRTMSAELSQTLTRLKGMRQEADEVRLTIGRERADLAGGAVTVSAKLARLNERIVHNSGATARNFHAAYQHVRELLPALRFPALIAPTFAPAEDICDHLLAATADFSTAEITDDGASRLAAHRGRYTMQQERAAHTAALGADELFDAGSVPAAVPAADSNPPAAVPALVPSHDLGEGVDLF